MQVECYKKLYTALGILGAALVIFGILNDYQKYYFVVGGILLLCTAIYFRLTYFIALELILISGHGAILLGIGPILQIILPSLLCLQLLIYYWLTNSLKNIFILIGIAGIGLLSVGFSYQQQWIFFTGSLCIAVYSFYCTSKNQGIALLWAILNSSFTIIAIIKLLAGAK